MAPPPVSLKDDLHPSAPHGFLLKPRVLFPGEMGASGMSLYPILAAEVLGCFLNGVLLGTESEFCHWIMLLGAILTSLILH